MEREGHGLSPGWAIRSKKNSVQNIRHDETPFLRPFNGPLVSTMFLLLSICLLLTTHSHYFSSLFPLPLKNDPLLDQYSAHCSPYTHCFVGASTALQQHRYLHTQLTLVSCSLRLLCSSKMLVNTHQTTWYTLPLGDSNTSPEANYSNWGGVSQFI